MLNTGPQDLFSALLKTYVFAEATLEELGFLMDEVSVETHPDHSALITEAQPVSNMFVLSSGSLVVKERISDQTDAIIGRIATGDLVGELGFVDGQTASASVRCEGKTEVIRIPFDGLERAFKKSPSLETKFFRSIAKTLSFRLRKTNHDLRKSLSVISGLRSSI